MSVIQRGFVKKDKEPERLISLDSTEAGASSQGDESQNQDDVVSPLGSYDTKTSWNQYAEPMQTLIFFDWDDTLFPTTELLDRWGLKVTPGQKEAINEEALCPEARAWLGTWRQSVQRLLSVACEASAQCTLVTNSKRPWVEDCIEQFVPSLKPLFSRENGPKVVYAREILQEHRKKRKIRPAVNAVPAKHTLPDVLGHAAKVREEMTSAKFVAMMSVATQFYKSYEGQSWKNIISFGDMPYEHEAAQELGLRRRTANPERLRVKSVLLPLEPKVSELSIRLEFLRMILPVFVNFNADLEVDLQNSIDPLWTMSKALCMPELHEANFLEHAWGEGPEPSEDDVQEALASLAATLHAVKG